MQIGETVKNCNDGASSILQFSAVHSVKHFALQTALSIPAKNTPSPCQTQDAAYPFPKAVGAERRGAVSSRY